MVTKLQNMLFGKKTYLVCLAALVYVGYGLYIKAIDTDTAIQVVLASLGAGSLRAAVSKTNSQ